MHESINYQLSTLTPSTVEWLSSHMHIEWEQARLLNKLKTFLLRGNTSEADLDLAQCTASELWSGKVFDNIPGESLGWLDENSDFPRVRAFVKGLPSDLSFDFSDIKDHSS